ncbi:LOW QUALITY PROTEIN: C-type lectin domain family 14 member A [Struthio camelus]|uniref:LOW QUALITY PROTEIN: C-type lectin domain family 14 member A n=1 Tax=Struthio camelus TaxID=8801 RepID=UPI003603CCF0
MLQFLHHLSSPSLDSLQKLHVSLVLGSPELDTVLQPTLPELAYEDVVGGSVKSLAEVRGDNIYYSSLIYPASCPIIEGYQARDTFPPAGPWEGPARAGTELRRGQPQPSAAAPRRARGTMSGAAPWCLLLAAGCALARPPQPGRSAVRCQAAGTCFSAHLANCSYAEARSACGRRRGALAWLDDEPELRLVVALLAGVADGPDASLFWLGLRRNASACTDAAEPLRGFSWEAGGGAAPAALGRWAKEPARSCLTARCAGLLVAAGPAWGWKERPCQRESQGYVCKYSYEGACAALSPAGALGLDYHLPFGERSAGPGFSPPGTVLTVACPGPRGAVRLTCEPQRGGFAWRGAEEPVCPCPFGYLHPGTGRCADAAECRDAAAAGFACACAPGGRDGAPCAAPGATPAASRAAPTAAGGRLSAPAPGGTAGPPAIGAAAEDKTARPPPAPPSSSSSSSNYVFILVTVAVVVLVILVMTVLGVFKLCFNKKSAGRGSQELPAAGSEAEAGSAEQRGAACGD